MGRPSMFNSNYHKAMKRRKIVFRTLIVFIGLIVIFTTYNNSSIPNLKKMVGSLFISKNDNLAEKPQNEENVIPEVEEEKPPVVEKGEYVFKLSASENLTIIFEKHESGNKFIEAKSDVEGLTYDISSDGKFIVFDNPRTSDIWIYDIEGQYKKLNPDSYKEYKKDSIMERYNNNYAWAEKPVFLKDGRVVYQSFLPWFKRNNSYYLWIVDRDGKNNRRLLKTDQANPVKYSGFTEDGNLIIEIGSVKYWVNTENGTKHKIS